MPSLDASVGLLNALGDMTRVRLLALLGQGELSVAELTAVTELPQSRVSSHLGRLREAGFVRDRKVGASSRYSLNEEAMPTEARSLWGLVSSKLDDATLRADSRRLGEFLRAQSAGLPWVETIAGEMERHYSPGRTWEATARGLLGFIELGDVLDAGSGDGALAELLAPHAKSIACLDRSERMAQAAGRRLSRFDHARAIVARMEEMPFDAASFDQVLCFNALTYVPDPARALAEIRRVLRPGGRLSLVCLHRHSHQTVAEQYGHIHAGFSVPDLAQLLRNAGFRVGSCAVRCRERRKPYFEVLAAFARAAHSSD